MRSCTSRCSAQISPSRSRAFWIPDRAAVYRRITAEMSGASREIEMRFSAGRLPGNRPFSRADQQENRDEISECEVDAAATCRHLRRLHYHGNRLRFHAVRWESDHI